MASTRGFEQQLVVVARGRFVAAIGFDDRDVAIVVDLHLFVLEAELAQELDPAKLKPDEEVGVVDDSHLIGLGITHADSGLGNWHG